MSQPLTKQQWSDCGPRVDHAYCVMQLDPLEHPEPPIISLRWRRVTFIETTWDRFEMAQEINKLYASGVDGLFVTLKEMGLTPERQFLLREASEDYIVDLAIPFQNGTLAIVLNDRTRPSGALCYDSGS